MPLRSRPILRAALLLCLFPASHAAFAGAADPVYTPTVEQGETEFELRGGYRDYADEPDEHAFVFDIGYGVNNRWRTEAVLEYAAEGRLPVKPAYTPSSGVPARKSRVSESVVRSKVAKKFR